MRKLQDLAVAERHDVERAPAGGEEGR
jgi:hypothetical protein